MVVSSASLRESKSIGQNDALFGAEVPVDRGRRDFGGVGDLLDADLLEAVCVEQVKGDIDVCGASLRAACAL